jgi:hypothetical protein
MIVKKLFLCLVLVPAMLMLSNRNVSFSKVIEGPIQVDMESAEFIAAVVIMDIEARKEDRIYTYITYRPIEILKGDPDSLPYTIRMMGGKVGNERLIVSDIPQFEVGEKYLLFLKFDNPYCPILGRYLRTFKIRHDPNLNRERVLSYHDENIYGFHDDGKVLKEQRSGRDEPVGLELFRDYIGRISGRKNY